MELAGTVALSWIVGYAFRAVTRGRLGFLLVAVCLNVLLVGVFVAPMILCPAAIAAVYIAAIASAPHLGRDREAMEHMLVALVAAGMAGGIYGVVLGGVAGFFIGVSNAWGSWGPDGGVVGGMSGGVGGFLAGTLGASLGRPHGWAIGGALGAALPLAMMLPGGATAGMGVWILWVPALSGAALGLWMGRAIELAGPIVAEGLPCPPVQLPLLPSLVRTLHRSPLRTWTLTDEPSHRSSPSLEEHQERLAGHDDPAAG